MNNELELSDALKAKGLGFRQDYVDIYSNSWGPDNTGHEVAEIGVMTERVLNQGALQVVCLSIQPSFSQTVSLSSLGCTVKN